MPLVKSKPIASFLARKRRGQQAISTVTCNFLASANCDSPFLSKKQQKLTDNSEDYKDSEQGLKRLKRSSSVRFSRSKSTKCMAFWGQSQLNFTFVLNDKENLSNFRYFLVKEFSEENLDFWCQCESYKKEKSNKQKKMAFKIFQRFIAPNSPNEINIDEATRMTTMKNIENPNDKTFEIAQNKIYKLMEKDSFQRYLNTRTLGFVTPTTRRSIRILPTLDSSSLLLHAVDTQKISKKLRRKSTFDL